MSLWHIPTSNSEARERPKLVQTKPPPIDFSKMKSDNHSAANAHARPMFRMPKSKFTRPTNRATFAVPVGMLNHASSSSDESSSDDEVAILERDRLEIERIRKKRMNEKGIGLYNRSEQSPYGQQSAYQYHDPIEEQRQLQEEIEELKQQEEDKREEERQKARDLESQRRQEDEKRRKQLERNKRNAELRRRKEEEQIEVEKREKVMEERRSSLLERKTKISTKMDNTNRSEHYKKTLKQELTPLQKYKKAEHEKERAELEAREQAERERREREAKEVEDAEKQRLARRVERQRREQAEKQLEQQQRAEETRRREEREKREKEQREAEEKYRAQKLEDERLKQKEVDEKRKRAEEVRKRAERACASAKKEVDKKTDEKNDRVRKELESIKAEVNATFAKKTAKPEPETKVDKKSEKMAFSHLSQTMEPTAEQRYVAPKRYGLYVEEEVDNGIKITSSRSKDKAKDAEARRRAEENRKWIESMTVKAKPRQKVDNRNTSNINPNILAAVTHTDKKPLVQPAKDEDKPTGLIDEPKIITQVNPRDALIEKLKNKKTDPVIVNDIIVPVNEAIGSTTRIVVTAETTDEQLKPSVVVDDPIKGDEPIKEKKPKKKKLESIPQETELEPFTDDDEDDLFQLKTFEINYMWTWDVANETCAICRSSLMELSPNQMSNENTVVIIWGECGHSFHNGCMAQWTRNNPRCPLCQQDWVVLRISREH